MYVVLHNNTNNTNKTSDMRWRTFFEFCTAYPQHCNVQLIIYIYYILFIRDSLMKISRGSQI